MLTDGYEYDYVTRTSQNQGVLQTTGFVNKEHINPAGVWSLEFGSFTDGFLL